MVTDPYVAVGRISRAHGLKGEVSVVSDARASLDLLVGCEVWFVPPPSGGTRTACVSATRQGPKATLVTFEGVTTVDEASALCGCEILVRAEDLPSDWARQEDVDHTGFAVWDDAHGELGTVDETIVTGANDVWVVTGPMGEVLVPVIDDVVLDVDEDARRIHVALLPGLLEGTDE